MSQRKIKLKVCGMKHPENIQEVMGLAPDYMGFIFYSKSPRFVADHLSGSFLDELSSNIKRVGVFVNEDIESIREKVKVFSLDAVQLHGNEPIEDCRTLKKEGLTVIKVFSVGEQFDFDVLEPYKPHVDFFLFDTKGKDYGGNGIAFDWSILKQYDNEVPFFLSGGIDLENISEIAQLKGLNIHAIDVNSRFELEPGLKEVEKLKKLKKILMSSN
ncbi:phosphoribosylanthranilate isomerase [Fulvivirgaceae bacterium BMA10]|uniref:N-(5'-phosphoribosyl)anthranilate isomerase n=1 Tax=Splendidivirga corallicola TaxID=3051826 RepID=A0ABT8KGH9_9BACT|nr:phosphoribosylanthranilate isomerase [Fulvivirgaceae bacterium BMA10]